MQHLTLELRLMKFTNVVFVCLFLLGLAGACVRNEHGGEADSKFVDSLLDNNINILYSAPKRADSIFEASQQLVSDSEAWYKLELYRGIAHCFSGDTITMHRMQNNVKEWFTKQKDATELEGIYWNHKGVYNLTAGKYDTAKKFYENAYKALLHGHDSKALIAICINLADVCFLTGHIPEAADYYRRALSIIDSTDNKKDLVAVHTGLGRIYTELENFTEAHRFFDSAKDKLTGISNHDLFIYYLSAGNCLFFEKRYPEALEKFKQAYSVSDLLNEELYRMQCEANIGETLLFMHKPEEAHKYIDRAMPYLETHPDCDPSLVFYLKSLAAGLALDEGRIDAAAQLLKEVESITEVQIPRYKMLHYRRLQHYATIRGHWRDAYEYATKADIYEDSLRSNITENNVNEIRFRYLQDTTLLHQQILIAEYGEESLKQRNLIVMILSLAVIAGLVSVVVIMVLRRRAHKHIAKQLTEITKLRMDVIRNRVSPHYVLNVLSAALPKFRIYPELTRPIDLLIDVLRNNLLASGKMAQELSDEIELVQNYINLRHYVAGEYPTVEWKNDGNVPMDIHVPTMCIQIPVENAFKHAFAEISAESKIEIALSFVDDKLHIDITDNGDGYNPGRIKRTGTDTGTGLRVLSRTIELLNAHNKEYMQFDIQNMETPQQGTRVHFIIPQKYNYSLEI
ncbi:MAG: tetratricopeptide repeat protein [Prevotellaceae bacterium]|nr:tetratricopeptide repeat protein [Prevotellaceae bacterium]